MEASGEQSTNMEQQTLELFGVVEGVNECKRNILIIENGRGVTGAFKSIFNMAQMLREDFNFLFFVPEGNQCTPLLDKKDFTWYESSFPLLSKSLLQILKFVPNAIMFFIKLLWIVKRETIAIIHLNDFYNFVPYAIKILHPRVKIVTHIRLRKKSLPGRYYDFLVKLALRYADQIICVSDVVIKDCPLLANQPKVKRIYRGVSSPYFRAIQKYRKIN
jgi:glycosyltransferase involved in cell wall biosynthesis